jgi:uncharacterized protein (DUF305 family)
MPIHHQLAVYFADNAIKQDEREAIKACNDWVGADRKRDVSEVALLQRTISTLGG